MVGSSKVAPSIGNVKTQLPIAKTCTCATLDERSVGTAQANDWIHTKVAQSKEQVDEKFVYA
jgi:hypothetical protein